MEFHQPQFHKIQWKSIEFLGKFHGKYGKNSSNAYEKFHGIAWGIPWNSIFHGIFHGIFLWISMEFNGISWKLP
jgi:hypothetical protein